MNLAKWTTLLSLALVMAAPQAEAQRAPKGNKRAVKPGRYLPPTVDHGRGGRSGRQRGGMTDTIIINLNGAHYRGANTIGLKQLINQYARGSIRQAKLLSVEVFAKSKLGYAQLSLSVAGYNSYAAQVPGHPADFHNSHDYTYSRIILRNPSGGMNGAWQLHAQGNIKISHLKVKLQNLQRGTGNQIRVPLYGAHYRGINSIALKRQIKQMYPHMQLQNATLRGVTLIAKSRRGNASANLVVGGSSGYQKYIPAAYNNFHSNDPYSFSRIHLNAPNYSSYGGWQLNLQGNIKVQEIIVQL